MKRLCSRIGVAVMASGMAVLASVAGLAAPASAVTNGTSPAPGTYPFHVKVGECSGTLIDQQWVITNAHCQERATVRVGWASASSPGTSTPILERVTNPDPDLALLRIAPVYGSRPIPYSTTPLTLGAAVRVIGTGNTTAQDTFDHITTGLFQNLGEWGYPSSIRVTSTTAALCYGDEGGPMVSETPSGQVLAGVFTDFLRCGVNTYGVDVGRVSGWIAQTIAEHTDRTFAFAQASCTGGRATVRLASSLQQSAQRVMIWVNGAYVGETYQGSSYYASVATSVGYTTVTAGPSVRTGDHVQVGIVPGTPGGTPPAPASSQLLSDVTCDTIRSAVLTSDGHVTFSLASWLFDSRNQVTVYVNGAYHGATNSGVAYYLGGYRSGDTVTLTTGDGGFRRGDSLRITSGDQTIYAATL